jgi:hypothetical protein
MAEPKPGTIASLEFRSTWLLSVRAHKHPELNSQTEHPVSSHSLPIQQVPGSDYGSCALLVKREVGMTSYSSTCLIKWLDFHKMTGVIRAEWSSQNSSSPKVRKSPDYLPMRSHYAIRARKHAAQLTLRDNDILLYPTVPYERSPRKWCCPPGAGLLLTEGVICEKSLARCPANARASALRRQYAWQRNVQSGRGGCTRYDTL